ncbi:RAMP superfamily CRISPR-associated protein [Carboxydocella sp. JDF658]|uniref:RAMP superfamily CRISPR-associated protein n=1 Tax=Carboxydocella sp. JDF658 TaxID=1926600 RepID=UPI0009D3CE27|nr:RAMP superfamily CRISPR-associated protein [Carboxydocella sp. JDF658]GAW32182.1 hypothetical protein JDF658_19470 [Carboxydocella sp. JDF658]
MSNRETLLKDKPYAFVPLTGRVDRTAAISHDKLQSGLYTGFLEVTIKTLLPLHIGSGKFVFHNQRWHKQFVRFNGLPVIPGSSLKGAVRAIAEAVSYSCLLQHPKKPENAVPEQLLKCNHREKLCPACRLFGFAGGKSQQLKSHLRFFDLQLVQPRPEIALEYIQLPQLEKPNKDYPKNNKGFGNERLYYCHICRQDWPNCCQNCGKQQYFRLKERNPGAQPLFRGRKFYFHLRLRKIETGRIFTEVIKANSLFSGEIYVENISRDQLALLAFSLGLDGSFKPKLGYGKPAYLGSVEITVRPRPAANPLLSTASWPDLVELAREYASQAPAAQVKKLREILSFEQPRGEGWRQEGGNRIY